MRFETECYILLFFGGAVLGWLMEVACKYAQFHRFINRGFLIGPYCPIYGFGAVLVTLLLSHYEDDPLTVFVMAMVVCGALEYLTSWLLEKLFHARWWDYSHRRFNLNGRVCANTLIPFGLLGLGMVYLAKPVLFGWFARIPEPLLGWLCAGLCLLLAADTAVSARVLGQIRSAAEHTEGDSTEMLTHKVREALSRRSRLARRQLRAFPDVHLYNRRLLERMRRARQELKDDLNARREKMRAEAEQAEKRLKEELQRLRGEK